MVQFFWPTVYTVYYCIRRAPYRNSHDAPKKSTCTNEIGKIVNHEETEYSCGKVLQTWHGSGGNYNFSVTFAYLIYSRQRFAECRKRTTHWEIWSRSSRAITNNKTLRSRHWTVKDYYKQSRTEAHRKQTRRAASVRQRHYRNTEPK